jgi:hypothetical protein
VLHFLKVLRDHLLAFYATFVRPWLDLIDTHAERAARAVVARHCAGRARWISGSARSRDAIEAPFRYVLAKVNEIVNIINRIVTLDGLFQRLALLGSLKRDYHLAWKAMTAPWIAGHTAPTDEETRTGAAGKPFPTVVRGHERVPA